MDSFLIEWKRSAEKELRSIDTSDIPPLVAAAEAVSENLFPVGCKKLQGAESIYRIRVGDYRIIYEVQVKQKKIVIEHIRHRKDAYRDY